MSFCRIDEDSVSRHFFLKGDIALDWLMSVILVECPQLLRCAIQVFHRSASSKSQKLTTFFCCFAIKVVSRNTCYAHLMNKMHCCIHGLQMLWLSFDDGALWLIIGIFVGSAPHLCTPHNKML